MPHESNAKLQEAMVTFQTLVNALSLELSQDRVYASLTAASKQQQELVVPLLRAAQSIIEGINEIFSTIDTEIHGVESRVEVNEQFLIDLDSRLMAVEQSASQNSISLDNHEQRITSLEGGA